MLRIVIKIKPLVIRICQHLNRSQVFAEVVATVAVVAEAMAVPLDATLFSVNYAIS